MSLENFNRRPVWGNISWLERVGDDDDDDDAYRCLMDRSPAACRLMMMHTAVSWVGALLRVDCPSADDVGRDICRQCKHFPCSVYR